MISLADAMARIETLEMCFDSLMASVTNLVAIVDDLYRFAPPKHSATQVAEAA